MKISISGIKEILSRKINFSGKTSSDAYREMEYRRVITVNDNSEEPQRAVKLISDGTGKSSITLSPMKSLSLEDFSFPFSNTTKISEALKLQVMPFTQAGEVEIFPVILNRSGRGANGIVWYVSPEELDVSSGSSNKVWPAPLPFISQLEENDGNGVTMWTDEENICSILWQSRKPVMYRWRKLSDDKSPSRELEFYDSYCKSLEIERGGNFIVNASNGEDVNEDFGEVVAESIEICPWIGDINLSRSALEGARDLERTVRTLTRVALWLLAAGVLMLGAETLKYIRNSEKKLAVYSRSEEYYRKTFDPERRGRISNPVTLARDRIASLTGKGDERHTIDEVLSELGEIFKGFKDAGMTIDIIRYNSEGIDCNGTAPDMTTVLNFRKSWESSASLAQVDNTQFVAGIGYRFDLRVRW
ncbi:MAG: hypothetical protein IJ697_07175 [Synergistaceae bacterium]|nr:hypothetical protein [Synergistaceae bacterium]